ncbi:hypothetical protein [Falsiphaeobacter marinintestinus]|uniref:hypothetical protein n=1 Tax=Falsiphaeobacter marinintestinus TaxID=1492905 RepID=UPI0011B43B34|nr:hypothetical protein [Phaeobacter marinintestinus]
MTQTDRYHGGLIYAGRLENALDRFCRIVASTLEDYGHQVERQTVLDDSLARVVTSQYMIKMTLAPWGNGRAHIHRSATLDQVAGLKPRPRPSAAKEENRIEFVITPVAPGEEDREVTELMLVVMLYRMVDALPVKQIEWLDPATVLSVEQFLSAFTNISPRRVRSRQEIMEPESRRFASVDDTEPGLAMQCEAILGRSPYAGQEGIIELTDQEALALAYRKDPRPDELADGEDRPSDVRRLATWGMTGMIAFLSAPVAASVVAVNLARGEDFRLNTQVLSLTGCLATLQGTGMLESAVAYLPL